MKASITKNGIRSIKNGERKLRSGEVQQYVLYRTAEVNSFK